MIHFEKENLEELIKEGNFLVDFYATWCGPCKMMEPVLKTIENKINIIKVDIDKFPIVAEKYRIMSVPTMIIFKNGNKEKEIIGFHSEEDLLNIIENL